MIRAQTSVAGQTVSVGRQWMGLGGVDLNPQNNLSTQSANQVILLLDEGSVGGW